MGDAKGSVSSTLRFHTKYVLCPGLVCPNDITARRACLPAPEKAAPSQRGRRRRQVESSQVALQLCRVHGMRDVMCVYKRCVK